LMQVFIVTFKVKIGFNGREALVVSCSSMEQGRLNLTDVSMQKSEAGLATGFPRRPT
jgi:hypothetical protein